MIPLTQLTIRPPKATAVYFLLLRGEVVYIGCARFPKERVAMHRAQGKRFGMAMYLPIPYDVDPKRVERYYISLYCPRHNRRGNCHYDREAYPPWGSSPHEWRGRWKLAADDPRRFYKRGPYRSRVVDWQNWSRVTSRKG